MRFAIYGVGAVGGYFGGRLAQGGEDVCGGVAKIFSSIAGPGHIRHSGVDPSVAFSEPETLSAETYVGVTGIIDSTVEEDYYNDIFAHFVSSRWQNCPHQPEST